MKKFYLTFMLFLTFAIMGIYAGSSIYKSDIENNISRDIFNYTDRVFSESYDGMNITGYDSQFDENKYYQRHISNMFIIAADGLIRFMFEYVKMFVEVGYQSEGKYDMGFFLTSIKIVLWLIAISVLIYPAMIVGVLIYEVVKYVRKKLKKYKGDKDGLSDIHS